MERTTKLRCAWGSTVIAILVVGAVAVLGLVLLASLTATASGTASLPNGATARINGPFSCSEKSQLTTIEAGGHTFAFSLNMISIDGARVAPLNATVADVEIDAASVPVTLRVNGQEVAIP